MEIIKKIAKVNGKTDFDISDDEISKAKEWVLGNKQFQEDQVASLKTLFNYKHKRITALIWPTWFSVSFVYYHFEGMVVMFKWWEVLTTSKSNIFVYL